MMMVSSPRDLIHRAARPGLVSPRIDISARGGRSIRTRSGPEALASPSSTVGPPRRRSSRSPTVDPFDVQRRPSCQFVD